MFARSFLRSLFVFFFLLTTCIPSRLRADPLACRSLPGLFDNYFRMHYTYRGLTPELRTRTVEQFVRSLDPSKTMLLEADVAKLKAELPAVFDSLRESSKNGACDPIAQANQLLLARAKENETFVRQFLGPNYELDKSVELVIDPEQRGYAKSMQERQAILEKMVHFQMANYLLANMKMAEAKKNLVHRYELICKRIAERDQEDLITSFAEAFALALDPHSGYMSKDRMEDFQIQMGLSLEGIGATLSSQDGFTVIEGLIPGGSAEKTGKLRPKDKIIAVAQEGEKPVPVIDMDLRDVVKMIRGKKGTKVTLTILRQGEKTETFDITIVRDKIDIKDQAASIRYEMRTSSNRSIKIGIIDLPSFYGGFGNGARNAYDDVRKLVIEAKKNKVNALVLDLSRNGGGLLDNAVRISGLFLKEGGIVATKDARGRIDILPDNDDEVLYTGPLVIVISRLSASASEILAGTLQAYNRAVIVGGDRTFGKGTVQSVVDLPNLGGMTVTIGMFFVANGASTQQNGVTADVVVPSLLIAEDIGENQLDYPLPPQRIEAFVSASANGNNPAERWAPITPEAKQILATKSKARIEKSAEFVKLMADLAERQRNKGRVKIADLFKATKKKSDNEDGSNGEAKQIVAPLLQEAINVAVDLVQL